MESGLLNLKAEIHKNKLKIKIPNEAPPLLHNSKYVLPGKPIVSKNCDAKAKEAEAKLSSLDLDEDEASKLAKSKSILEAKAILYERLKSGQENSEDEKIKQNFLVDFKRSELDEEDDNRRERSQADAEYIAARNAVRAQKWEKVIETAQQKEEIHYQDVLFDEARSHGVAFMPFSKDEAEREVQHNLLKELRAETKTVVSSRAEEAKTKKKLLQERLKKVRQRKRLKMGLPIRDDDLKTPPASDEESEEPEGAPLESNQEKEKEEDENKPVQKMREWDLGKPTVGEVMDEEKWVESRRKNRDSEFAPPSSYLAGKNSIKTKKGKKRKKNPTQHTFGNSGNEELLPETTNQVHPINNHGLGVSYQAQSMFPFVTTPASQGMWPQTGTVSQGSWPTTAFQGMLPQTGTAYQGSWPTTAFQGMLPQTGTAYQGSWPTTAFQGMLPQTGTAYQGSWPTTAFQGMLPQTGTAYQGSWPTTAFQGMLSQTGTAYQGSWPTTAFQGLGAFSCPAGVAPPGLFNTSNINQNISGNNETQYTNSERLNAFAPPATYEYYGPTNFHKWANPVVQNLSLDDAIIQGLQSLRKHGSS